MHIVEIRHVPAELSEIMAAMRVWLDQHRFEPSAFTYRDIGPEVELTIAFKLADEAEGFARHFGGRVKEPAGASPADQPKLAVALEIA